MRVDQYEFTQPHSRYAGGQRTPGMQQGFGRQGQGAGVRLMLKAVADDLRRQHQHARRPLALRQGSQQALIDHRVGAHRQVRTMLLDGGDRQ